MKIYIWPDGGWCEEHEAEEYQRVTGRSDDRVLVTVPETVSDIDAFVAAYLKVP